MLFPFGRRARWAWAVPPVMITTHAARKERDDSERFTDRGRWQVMTSPSGSSSKPYRANPTLVVARLVCARIGSDGVQAFCRGVYATDVPRFYGLFALSGEPTGGL